MISLGYSCQKLYPNCTLLYPDAKTGQLLLGVRKRSFAYTRKVVWAYANGYAKASRSLCKGTAHLFRLLRAPRLITSEQPFDYFGTAVWLLRNSRLITSDEPPESMTLRPDCSRGQSIAFASNVFKVSLLVKVMVLRKVPLSITLPKQLVLVS